MLFNLPDVLLIIFYTRALRPFAFTARIKETVGYPDSSSSIRLYMHASVAMALRATFPFNLDLRDLEVGRFSGV